MEEKTEAAPAEITKVKDLTPRSNKVNVLVKVTGVGEPREIPNKFGGEPRRVAEARVGDETGTIVLSLWQDQIGSVSEGDVLYIENGYITLFQGHMRLNVGKYGKMTKSDKDIPNVNAEVDVSAAEHERERREFRPSYGGGQRGGYGGGYRGRGRRY
ncbi:MAG: single-stranded DNA-binding protein [Candidatus Hadarchaeota archaeon]